MSLPCRVVVASQARCGRFDPEKPDNRVNFATPVTIRVQASPLRIFARRKRIGPYATAPLDPKQREKAIAAFLRAGHAYALARRWVDAAPGEVMEEDE